MVSGRTSLPWNGHRDIVYEQEGVALWVYQGPNLLNLGMARNGGISPSLSLTLWNNGAMLGYLNLKFFMSLCC